MATGVLPILRQFCEEPTACNRKRRNAMPQIKLVALKSSVPIGFMAALGTFRHAQTMADLGAVKLGWTPMGGQWCAVLETSNEVGADRFRTAIRRTTQEPWRTAGIHVVQSPEECRDRGSAPRCPACAGRRERQR